MADPFLRWAGGKQRLVRHLQRFAPDESQYRRYFEPFFGGGALYFALAPPNATIGDVNEDLMNCYRQVAVDPNGVSDLVQVHGRNDSPEYYYRIRDLLPEKSGPLQRAARFIYLNKAAFNGIYRVNRQGRFNVPYGPSTKGPALPSREKLIAAADCLRTARIMCGDFASVLEEAGTGDFVYLDPPYPPRSGTANFTHYSADRFSWSEQVRVAELFSELSDRGCLVMLSNAYQKKLLRLYQGYHRARVNAVRWLGANGDRFGVYEAVVTSYCAPRR